MDCFTYLSFMQGRKANVVYPDFFKPETTEWWETEIVQFRNESLKFDGIWIDMNEPASFINGKVGGCPANNEYEHPPYMPSKSFIS